MVVGINELTEHSRVVYPQPADHQIFFYDVNESKTIRVLDATGKLILSESNITNELNVSALCPGFYVLHITHRGGGEERVSVMVN